MERARQNVRIGLRALRSAPGFTVTAILTLALGIGLSTAVFTVANAVLLRGLPVLNQDRIVLLWGATRDGSVSNYPLTLAAAREFAAESKTLERVAFVSFEGAVPKPILQDDQVTLLRRALVSGTYFDVLGTSPILGRGLREEDNVAGAAPVAVLSYSAWRRTFGADASVVGQRLVMHDEGIAYRVVGVMPQGLDYPRGTDFWAPVIPARSSAPVWSWEYETLDIVGRLKAGATAERARLELSSFYQRPGASAFQRQWLAVVHTLPTLVVGDMRPALIAFAVAAGLLLLITCVNVANLLLVRGLTRRHEVALRAALGASRRHVVLQLLTESVMLAAAGGVLGVLVGMAAIRSFVLFAPDNVPRLDEMHFGGASVIGAIAITAIAMLIFGLAPAFMTSRVELHQLLGSGTRLSAGRRSRLLTEALVAGQVALAVLVLSAAGLVARTLVELERVDLTLEPSHLLIATLAIRSDQFETKEKQFALLDRVLPQLTAVPGIRSASPVNTAPYDGGWDGRPASEGQGKEEQARNPMLAIELVAPDYFTTLGIPVLRGRAFTAEDRPGAPPVVMLSAEAARHYWPDRDGIGQRLTMNAKGDWATVIGIVPETRYRDLRLPRPAIYYPIAQSTFPFAPSTLAIRTSGPPEQLVPAIRRAIAAVDPGVALASASPFEVLLEEPLSQPRLNALLLAVFALAAVALAAIGLFGVTSTMVRQRTRELGVRLALGATSLRLARMVVGRGLTIAAAGLALGLVGALLTNRLLSAMLFQVSPTDGLTLTVVTVGLMLVSILASLVPARSSTRVDPMQALRSEG